MASGLMLLTIGPSTRLSKFLTGLDKTYSADIRFGVGTDTLDAAGTVTERSDTEVVVDLDRLRAAASTMEGWIEQVVPDYAAVRVDGRRHHERARAGEPVPVVQRKVRIDRLDVVSSDTENASIQVTCSSGTYVRSIARDLGLALEFPAHITALRRESIGSFSVDNVHVSDLGSVHEIEAGLVEPADALPFLPQVVVDADSEQALRQGICIPVPDIDQPRLQVDSNIRVVSPQGELVCVGEYVDRKAVIQPRVVFPSGETR